ncbi:MAG TPA: copper ion binding protein, partial [Gammaproteobacteria bacterium]
MVASKSRLASEIGAEAAASPTHGALQRETLRVTGMTCGACSARVERVVGKLDGVTAASVNLATERMDVQFDTARIDLPQIRAAVEKAGYGIEEAEQAREILLPVEGMTCAACAARIEKVVGSLDGVRSIVVNLLADNARIRYLPAVTSLAAIREAIEATGYRTYEVVESSGSDDRQMQHDDALRRQRRDLLVALAFTLPLLAM